MNRTQWTLAGLLVAQLLLLVLIAAPWSGGVEAGGGGPLLPVLGSFTPARVQIGEGDESVTLERGDDGWAVADAGGYPAESQQVETVLDTLEGLKTGLPVVRSSRYHEALEVTEKKHQRRVRIWEGKDGEPTVDLFVGSSPNYRISHVRLGGDDRVYEVQGLSTYDLRTEASSWVKRKFVDIPFDDVVGVKVSNTHGSFELEKRDGQWATVSPARAGGELDASKVDSLARSLASLWLSEPAGPVDAAAQGFDAPAATVEIRHRVGGALPTSDAEPDAPEAAEEGEPAEQEPPRVETVTVRFGAEVPEGEGKRYAARSGFGYAAVLSKFDADKAVEKKLADLLVDKG